MPLKLVTSGVYLGGVGEFGNRTELEAAGVELAILCHGAKAFPHGTVSVATAAFEVGQDGGSPDWFIRGIVDVVLRAYGAKTFGLFDVNGGLGPASFIAASAYAQNQGTSLDAGLTWLRTTIPDATPSGGLISQGQTLWP